MMFGVLDRYIGKTILNTIMMTLFLLVSLSGIIKFVEQLRKVGKGSYNVLDAGLFTILSVPSDLEVFFPMAALLGALLGLGILAQRSELVVMQASGFSRLRVAIAVMKTALPLVIISMLIGEYVAPKGYEFAHDYRSQQTAGESLLSTQNGLWIKDGNKFIFIHHIRDKDHMQGISIYDFDHNKRLSSITYAEQALWQAATQSWLLTQVERSLLDNPQKINGSQRLTEQWKTALTPEKIGVVALDPDALSIRGLHDYINYLKQSGQTTERYQLNMYSKIIQPLSVAVMMLMALSFIFGPLRSVSMGFRVLTGISCGFLFYVLDKIFGPLSLVYGFPPILGAILPSALFLSVSIYLLIKRR